MNLFLDSQLYFITPNIDDHEKVRTMVTEACRAGIKWIQLRVKNQDYENILELAKELKQVCNFFKSKLIINDQIDIALAIKADGVHLGKNDMAISEARKLLGKDFIIGGSANTFEDIKMCHDDVDYIGLGPFRFTETKKHLSPVLGVEKIRNICRQCQELKIQTPIIAIGGITIDDIDALFLTGIKGCAISADLATSNNIFYKTREYFNKLNYAGISNC